MVLEVFHRVILNLSCTVDDGSAQGTLSRARMSSSVASAGLSVLGLLSQPPLLSSRQPHPNSTLPWARDLCHVTKGSALSAMLCCHLLEIFNFWTRRLRIFILSGALGNRFWLWECHFWSYLYPLILQSPCCFSGLSSALCLMMCLFSDITNGSSSRYAKQLHPSATLAPTISFSSFSLPYVALLYS